jgi:hypothetical protein
MENIVVQQGQFILSKNVLLNNSAIKATVERKNDKVGGNLGKKIFYDWYGWTYRSRENIPDKSVN